MIIKDGSFVDMITQPQSYLKELRYWHTLIVGLVLLGMSAMFWYSISPFTYHDYLRICQANYSGVGFSHCMSQYWMQFPAFLVVIYVNLLISLLLFLSTLVLFIYRHR